MTDYLTMDRSGEYINIRQFTAKAKEMWGWSPEESKLRWDQAVLNPSMPKGKDMAGWQTMPIIDSMTQSSGRSVSHAKKLGTSSKDRHL